jgi:poly(3-hydroxybutyrate) depolymerase
MEHGELDVAGVRRTYWLARGPGAQAPLLMMLPGSGTTGKDIATTFTGLATRGPDAGVTVVFPNGWGDVWHVAGPPPGEPVLDDAAFLRALACQLQETAEPQPLILAGISNGAGFAEHAGRHGLLPLVLYRIEGGGHGWPGGPQYLPARTVGPIPRQLDATQILLDMVAARS